MTKKKEKEEPLSKEEAEQQVKDLPDATRATLEKYWKAYRDLRQLFGPGVHITREDVAFAAGTNSIDMASKFMAWIEPIEGDQPFQTRPKKPNRQAKQGGTAPSQHHPAVQAAIDAVGKALETVCKAFGDTQAAEVAEITRGFQTALQEQGAEAEGQHQADETYIADLQKAASGSANKSWLNHEAAQELRTKLVVIEAELNAAVARAERADHGKELAQVKLASAEEQVAALQTREALQLAEVSRERQGQEAAVAQAAELRAEIRTWQERAAALGDQVARLQTGFDQLQGRHEQEISAIRETSDRELGDERQRATEAVSTRENEAIRARSELDECRRQHLAELAQLQAVHAQEIERQGLLTAAVVDALKAVGKPVEGGLQ